MVNNNKVLTVSYGTFSCTLEGFDDSFGTMKAIAEYFRDLAADDRYFGAEPPQPDADMLARIAQKTISRQVEARTGDQGIVLRAAEQSAAPALAPAPETIRETAADAAPEIEAEAPVAPIEDAKAEQPAEDLVTLAPVDAKTPLSSDMEEEEQVAATEPLTEPVSTEPVLSEPEEDAATEVEEQVAEDLTEDAALEPQLDSIAAKLQRIRAVVSRAPDQAEGDFTEDEHAEAISIDEAEDLTDLLHTSEAEADDEIEHAAVSDLVETDREVSEAAEHAEPVQAAIETPAETTPKGEDSLFGDWDEDDFDDDDELLNILNADEDEDEDIELEPLPETPVRVRVSRVKRAAVEAATAAGALDELDDLSDDSVESGRLSEEDEADLVRELEAVSQMTGDETEPSFAEDEIASATSDEAEIDTLQEIEDAAFEDGTEEHLEDGEEDLSRLLAMAEAKLDEPEGSDNRDTFTQLRAVVAAADAERQAGGTVGIHHDPEPYKEDLASVVRPRRPVSGQGRAERPAAPSRAAPLKLVAEQRIDVDKPAENKRPVRPRRIRQVEQPAPAATAGSEGGFASYASEHGVSAMPELFEAAAAYLTYVENRPQFSRPQLMNQIRELQLADFTREDGLRAFGQILRDGKIIKVASGRFTASADIGFQPDARAAG